LPSLALWLAVAAAAVAVYFQFNPGARVASPEELIRRGLSLADEERYTDALGQLEPALAIIDAPRAPSRGASATATPTLPQLAPALVAIGRARLALGNATGSIPPLERALGLLGGAGVREGTEGAARDELKHASVLQLLGEALCALPDEENAARVGRSALARAYKLRKIELAAARANATSAGGPAPVREARTVAALEIALCSANQQVGDSERSISYGRKALSFFKDADGLASMSTANAVNLLSVALSIRGTTEDLEEAEGAIRLVLGAINTDKSKSATPVGGTTVLHLEAAHCALFLRLGRASSPLLSLPRHAPPLAALSPSTPFAHATPPSPLAQAPSMPFLAALARSRGQRLCRAVVRRSCSESCTRTLALRRLSWVAGSRRSKARRVQRRSLPARPASAPSTCRTRLSLSTARTRRSRGCLCRRQRA
jgi:tetratricopeptide (TPR) repeat protein